MRLIEKRDIEGLVKLGWSGDAIVGAILGGALHGIKAIPLDKVKQTRKEIQKLVDMLSDDTVADLNMKSGLGMALEKIDELIIESEGK